MTFDPSSRSDALLAYNARAAQQTLDRNAAEGRAIGDAARTARLNMLEQTFHDMQRQQPDLWGHGFDSAEAARRCLPLVENLVTE